MEIPSRSLLCTINVSTAVVHSNCYSDVWVINIKGLRS